MGTRTITVYGKGGYDTSKPNNNLAGTDEVTVPDDVLNAEELRKRLRAYLAVGSPSVAQREKALRGLIKLALGILDDISDTA